MIKKVGLAVLSGVLFFLSWPTYGFPFLAFLGFVPLLILAFQERQSKTKYRNWRVFALAYLAFFIWNIGTTYWLYFSTPFGAAFAIFVNSLLMALVFQIYHIIAYKVNFTASMSFFIGIWLSFEKMHLAWEFSWPWLNLGNVFSEYTAAVQWYEYTGSFGGSLWVLLMNAFIFKSILLYQQHRERAIIYRRSFYSILLILVPIGLSLIIKGYQPKKYNTYKKVLIVQPNIDPYEEKYDLDDDEIKRMILKRTRSKLNDSIDLLLLPETVFANGTRMHQLQNAPISQMTDELQDRYPNLNVLSGISMYKIIRDEKHTSAQSNFLREGIWFNDYNAAYFKKPDTASGLYYKSKLVVGVENFPYKSTLEPILGDLMIDLGGTVAMKTTQDDREVFTLSDGTKTAPIICYESVYGAYVGGYVKNGADFLSIITNDAWWKDTQGHQQHWSYAKLRAIEMRKSIVRSANTGISGAINPYARVLNKTNYNEPAVISVAIPIEQKRTFYADHGDYIARIGQFFTLAIFMIAVFKRKR
ncbi:MAG: apolipoprotein N-acyltransferase [Psychroflexus sp.]|nr:apolipoprotein N-acyltransferase [Psychroflexus sp.]MDR9449273.1 apolipoprotein N-acyltransferase [Psychroflexus sp.]